MYDDDVCLQVALLRAYDCTLLLLSVAFISMLRFERWEFSRSQIKDCCSILQALWRTVVLIQKLS